MSKKQSSCPWWKSTKGIVALVALAVLGLYLIIVHQQHILGALPFLVILLCPLSHLFMHGKHHTHSKNGEDNDQENNAKHEHKDGCH